MPPLQCQADIKQKFLAQWHESAGGLESPVLAGRKSSNFLPHWPSLVFGRMLCKLLGEEIPDHHLTPDYESSAALLAAEYGRKRPVLS